MRNLSVSYLPTPEPPLPFRHLPLARGRLPSLAGERGFSRYDQHGLIPGKYKTFSQGRVTDE
jgi:hypothetical protein